MPVAMNIAVALLFCWRVYYIAPFYGQMLLIALGYGSDVEAKPANMTWPALVSVLLRRTFTFCFDFFCLVFFYPWPVEFCLKRTNGSPAQWRWSVGFRDEEIYVRRSRNWDATLGDVLADTQARDALLSRLEAATSPMLIQEKTGYVTMNGEWDLDWALMISATRLVDEKTVPLDAFCCVVLLHDSHSNSWLSIRQNVGKGGPERQRKILAFRDALTAAGKEDLFYNWIETVQLEVSRPGGLDGERQIIIAQKIRDEFLAQGVDFDKLWQEAAGSNYEPGETDTKSL